MVTFQQYIRGNRKTKLFKSSTPHFHGCPFKYGICLRISIVKPKKPNSAHRKIARVKLTNDRELLAYIPGFGAELQKNNEVMVRGGRVPDLPGVHYKLIRKKRDFTKTSEMEEGRSVRRSKFGLKKIDKSFRIPRFKMRKIEKKKAKEAKLVFSDELMEERLVLIKNTFLE